MEELYNVVDDDDGDQSPVSVPTCKVHLFYFVKLYQELQEGIDKTLNLHQRMRACDVEISHTKRDLDQKKSSRKILLSYDTDRWRSDRQQYRYRTEYRNHYINDKESELRGLQYALKKKLMLSSKKSKETDDTECEEENNFHLSKLYYRKVHHGANNLAEEKKMIKGFRQELEDDRIAEEERRASLKNAPYYHGYYYCQNYNNVESSCSLKELKQKIELVEIALDELRMEEAQESNEYLGKPMKLHNVDKDIESLQKKMSRLKQQKDELDNMFTKTRRHNAKMKDGYYHTIMQKAISLAEEKNIEAVKELSRAGVDKFMSEWNNNAAFRKNYVRKNSGSLERRQLTKDGFSKTLN